MRFFIFLVCKEPQPVSQQVKLINLQKQESFQMNRKQKSQLLNKVYQLNNSLSSKQLTQLKIYIRKKVNEDKLDLPPTYSKVIHLVELYEGVANRALPASEN